MSISTLGLGGGGYCGVGLRQAGSIQEPDITGINTFNGLGVIFYSPSNEQIANLTAGRGEGVKLEASLTFQKYGNLKDFEIVMLRNNEIPFFNGMNVRFYYQNLAFAYGFVDTVPETDQKRSTVEISGSGYTSKLKDKKISASYTSNTIEYIIDDLGTTYFSDLGINYNSLKNNPPNITISSVAWDDKDLLKIINDLIAISNNNFDTVEYIYGIDEFGDFYFKGIAETEIVSSYFEGFNYQDPKVDNDASDIVNRVQLYRTQSGNEKESEYVDTFSNDNSIDQYGLYERKVTFSDFLDDTTAENAANGIIENHKFPKYRIDVEDLIIDNVLEYGYYVINNKQQDQKLLISDFATSTEWTQSLTTSSISIIDSPVYTGRLCYEWDINNSVDDYISKEIEYYNPTKLRLYIRQDTAGEYLSILIDGTHKEPGYLVDNNDKYFLTDTDIPIGTLSGYQAEGINVPFSDDWIAVDFDLSYYFKITDVTITVIDASNVTILLDRMEVYTDSYVQRTLSLEDVSYTMDDKSIKCKDATFGTDRIMVTEELKKLDEENKVAVEIFSKQ